MRYLINNVVTLRIHTVEEVEELHEELKHDHRFELVQFSYTTKDIKAKGEIIDQYQLVKYKVVFTDEKHPVATYSINYEEADNAF